MLSYKKIKETFEAQPLFEDKTWKYSPEPWKLNPKQVQEIEKIGQACYEFYRAVELLYTRSWQGKNILRNRELQVPWVAEYLDRGKPQDLIDHCRKKALKASTPVVIRPDLLITEEGFALTEIDSVPGGIGLTAFLNDFYAENGFKETLLSNVDMLTAFYESLAELSDAENPVIALVVSDESQTYRPEMDWIASKLQASTKRVFACHPSELESKEDSLYLKVNEESLKIDVIYRFWELFDHENISEIPSIVAAREQGNVQLTPPMKAFQEEKLNLALFHHHLLDSFWKENLSKGSYKVLKKVIPEGWIVDPVDLPQNAVLYAPYVGGRPISRWEELAEASQKERNLILKMSGFHEDAWGARSVLLGSDSSKTEWTEGLKEAIEGADKHLQILQNFKKPSRNTHAILFEDETIKNVQGRVRLCPYYFVKKEKAELGGVLSTFCPADKKIIHGMKDAALLPCQLEG